MRLRYPCPLVVGCFLVLLVMSMVGVQQIGKLAQLLPDEVVSRSLASRNWRLAFGATRRSTDVP